MIGLGAVSLLDQVIARVQSRVAKFLAQKEVLVNLSQSSVLSIRSRAIELLGMQKQLEGEMGDVYKLIDKVKEGAWTFGDAYDIGEFATAMEKHIKNVQELGEQAGSGVYTPSIISTIPWSVIGVTAAVLLGSWIIWRKA